jgi:Rrf2 family transcriptional regulator, cysteine metabolism repressor
MPLRSSTKGILMKLSRTVGYALQATLQLAEAEPGTPIPCSQLAAHGNMPERFLLQILRNLVTHGILHSTRGVDGGYALKRKPEEISLLDLIEATDGPLFAQIPLADGAPPESVEQLTAALQQVTAQAREQLASIKISSFVPHTPAQAWSNPGT